MTNPYCIPLLDPYNTDMNNNNNNSQDVINNQPHLREWIRRQAGMYADYPYPIVVVPGRKAPSPEGEGGYFTTPSGKTRVMHPGAYKWPTVYHCSTMRIEVGESWLRAKRPKTFSRWAS